MGFARIAAWGVLAGLVVVGAAVFLMRGAPEDPSIVADREVRRVTVKVAPASVRTNASTTVRVTALDEDGDALPAWSGGVTSAWLVRSDLAYATRPEILADDAESSVPVVVRPTEPGSYRLVIENRLEDAVMVGATAMTATGASGDAAPREQSAAREGFAVVASTIPETGKLRAQTPVSVTYRVTRTGTPVALDEQDGARGEVVAFHDGAGLFVHAEPLDAALLPSAATSAFTIVFPQSGRYRLFFEFSVSGRTFTDARWIDVGAAQ